MSVGTSEHPEFEDYVFGVRRGFFDSAKEELSGLERMIDEGGYAWLDGYVDAIVAGSSKAPISELMKTPSRTQTGKKTRATTAGAKERTGKVKGLNARLGLSPVLPKSTTTTRHPLSPLQPRSLNTVTLAPLTTASPAKGAKPMTKGKGKASAPVAEDLEKPVKGKKGKKGKAKTLVEAEDAYVTMGDEVPLVMEPPTVQFDDPPNHAASKAGTARHKRDAISHWRDDQPSDTVPSPTPSKTSGEPAPDTPEAASESPFRTETVEETLRPGSLAPTLATSTTDLSMIVEGEEESSSSSARSVGQAAIQPLPELPTPESTGTEDENIVIPSGKQPALGAVLSSDARILAPTVITSTPTSEPAVPPSVNTGAALPVRQVRSSWLSKALGTGTVPISGLANAASDSNHLRKSYAAPTQRPNPVDFDGIRKSLVPVTGLKRKSDVGLDEDEEEEMEEPRPEKMARVDFTLAPFVKAVVELPSQVPATLPAPEVAPVASALLPPAVAPPIVPEELTSALNPRSDIHKVTRALDELRERAQAKDLAKQRATPAAAPKATSTGSGFLRGLGNLGRSLCLGGSAKTAEEEAERIEEERRAEIQAREELERLIGEVSAPAQSVETVVRSTSPEATVTAAWALEFRDDEVEGEVEIHEEMEAQPNRARRPTLIEPQALQRPSTPPQPVKAPVESTTPAETPPRTLPRVAEAPAIHSRPEKHVHLSPAKVVRVPVEGGITQAIRVQAAPILGKELNGVLSREPKEPPESVPAEDVMMDTEREDMGDDEEDAEVPVKAAAVRTRALPSSSSTGSLATTNPLGASTSSQATSNGLFGQASTIAGKTMGYKPTTGPVKSLQLAAVAAKKEQVANDRKALMRDQADQRKQQAIQRKAEEDRVRMEEERKAKIAELEEKKRLRAEHEKRRKEREERMAQQAKEKALKEEREAAEARARLEAEEEANKKRKLAPTLNKSGPFNPAKRVAAPAAVLPILATKPKDPARPIKPSITLVSSSTAPPNKMGPTTFRTAETSSVVVTTQTSTVTLVNPQGERRPLGPPSRPSAMAHPLRQSTAVPQPNHHRASTVLQQSRIALQSQLDEKALEMQSEDIVLPDIASEYSDSDDSDKEDAFERPTWAESPQLREALEQQAHRNPDELFGPIRPISMEELFKVRQGKFRARSSSANWSGGDRLTRTEEVEYARRMGFKPMIGVAREGSGQGHGQP